MITDSTVGPLALPLDPGAPNTALVDPLLDGVLEFCGLYVNGDITAKAANMGTGTPAQPMPIPPKNMHAWDPLTKPHGVFARGKGDGAANPLPALYAWRAGNGRRAYTFLTGLRRVTVMVCYIGAQLTAPDDWDALNGLQGAIEASIQRGFEIGWHAQYQGGANISVALKLAGQGIWYGKTEPRLLHPVPAASQADQPKTRGFPAVLCTLFAEEGVGIPQTTPADTAPDLQVSLGLIGDPDLADLPGLLNGVFPGPPGERDT